ncbi:MAG: cation:proton antiporter [Clostridia bacterium]
MQILFCVAAAMIGGLLLTRIVKLIHLPNVTGYLIAGLLVGPFCLNLLPTTALPKLDIITTVALGFIAFSIGGEFKLTHIKAIGRKAIIITVCQAMGAVVLVDCVLIACGFDVPLALVLGAIATATAPAATLLVVRQYKAKGEVTNTLLPVVAMDDALGLMVFSISMAIAQSLSNGSAIRFSGTVIKPVVEIVCSLLGGGILGLLLALAMRFFHSKANRLGLCIAAIVLGVAIAKQFQWSDLLVCMSIGAVFVNLRNDAMETLDEIDSWTPPLFLLFFVISGAELNITALPAVGLLGAVYIVTRAIGKYFGAFLGAAAVKASPNIRKYLGIALLPQAGVAIGMAQLALTQLPKYGTVIQAVALSATLIYELIGPVLTKMALTKAGEIQPGTQKKTPAHQ